MSATQNPFQTITANNVPKNLLSYDGKLGKLYAISIKNFFLRIITLGIYSAWATNNMRKYIFTSFSIAGDRLEYSGKGGQLFKGFLIIFVSYLILAAALNFVTQAVFPDEYNELLIADGFEAPEEPAVNPELSAVTNARGEFNISLCLAMNSADKCNELYILNQNKPFVPELVQPELSSSALLLQSTQVILGIAALMTASFFAKFSTTRFRLTRVKWRGIAGGIKGATAKGYIALRFKRFLLNLATLGFLIGRSDLIANKYMLNNAYVGNTKFNFEPDFKKLDKVNLLTLILALPTLGLSRIWYRAAFLNYKYKNLSIAGIRFESSFSGGKLLWLYISNILIILCTLLIGTPITTQRSLKFFAANLRVMGNVENLQLIEQQFKSEILGEGTEQAFDLGQSDIDFGVI